MRDFFFKDLAWKLFSLMLAVVIWFTVHRNIVESSLSKPTSGETTTQTYKSLPVTLVSASSDVQNYRALQPVVSVTVNGSKEIVSTLQTNQIHVLIDLTNTNAISSERQPVQVAVPPGVTVLNIRPETIGVLPPP